ncbi:MAG: polyprenyl synthetase family protein [Clostridia bacterium]|nr:polyprenyl synthetase family protein [Clostridia bacterium]
MNVKERLQQYADLTEQALEQALPAANTPYEAYNRLVEAMRYSVLGGGKRIRAALCLEFCRLCGGDPKDALPFACAVEMIHAYSLIHDDLPCMDDDDLRRGKPSCHIAFGEAVALLAGDALQACAFKTALNAKNIPAEQVIAATETLAKCCGYEGMCGGQAMDLDAEEHPVDFATLAEIHSGKTGMMIIAAAKMGCYAASATPEQWQAAEEYACEVGIIFQMVDDVLDVTATVEELGKPIGSDQECGKTTYVTLFGVEKTMEYAAVHNKRAKNALLAFGDEAEFLSELSDYLLTRKH